MSKKVTLVHSPEYANWFFSDDHPTQGRRFINGYNLIVSDQRILEPRLATTSELARVHSAGYINEVTSEHRSSEWSGAREDLARFATLFAGGTLVALDALLKDEADVAIHLPAAKHHAQYDHSSGFCAVIPLKPRVPPTATSSLLIPAQHQRNPLYQRLSSAQPLQK
ncbi:MAG: hypothetical protein NTW43_02555 [Actinobacteria bacterium]|nr:hypothetical protein [Actinomycetota bacterium]